MGPLSKEPEQPITGMNKSGQYVRGKPQTWAERRKRNREILKKNKEIKKARGQSTSAFDDNVRVDQLGTLHCYKCLNTNFVEQRKTSTKMLIGVGSLLTQKMLRCVVCGSYNRTGHARQITV